MNQNKELGITTFKLQGEEHVEFELLLSHHNIEDEIDSRLEKLDQRLGHLNSEIDRLTNHSTQTDIFISIASGIVSGIFDILYVGELKIDIDNGVDFTTRSQGAESVNRFIIEFAKKNGWNGSNYPDDNSQLSSAIKSLEDNFKMDQDDYRGVSSSKLHHLEDLAHHPTPMGLMAALLVTFFKVGIFSDAKGNLKLMPIKTSKKDLLLTWSPIIISGLLYWMSCWATRKFTEKELSEMPKWQRVLVKTFCASPMILAISKVAINWAGHLVSDMGGSKNTPDGGAGIPGIFLSLLKELSIMPPFNATSLPKDISDLYSKKHTDFRSELFPMQDSLGKQIIPVILNELIVSTFYFISRLRQQYDKCGGWKGINWRGTIPYGNRTIARMRMVSSGAFTAIDMADAAIRSAIKNGANWSKLIVDFVLRINIIGVGKFTVNLGNDVAMGMRRSKMRNIRMNVMVERLYLTHAKLYIIENDTWVAANETERAISNFQQSADKAVLAMSKILHQTSADFEECKDNLNSLAKTDETLSTEITPLIMGNLENYTVYDPTTNDVEEINSALAKSDNLVNEIILSADKIEETNDKIKRLVETARQQKGKKVGFWSGKKIAIESLQEFADLQADTINDLWLNQKLVFEQFSKLSETSNKLLFLGVANAAVTRALIEQLKVKSSKSLSEDARRHLLNVIKDLERQADAQDRINRLRDYTRSAIIKESEDRKKCIEDVNVLISGVQDRFFTLLEKERANRLSEMQDLLNSLNEIKATYALESSLALEIQERIAMFERCSSLILELESKMNNSQEILSETIRSSNEAHYKKDELFHNDFKQLKSKTKITSCISIIASLLAFISLLSRFFF